VKDTKSSGRTRSAAARGDAGINTAVSSSMVGVIGAAFVFSSSISTQVMHCAAAAAAEMQATTTSRAMLGRNPLVFAYPSSRTSRFCLRESVW